MKRKIDTNAVYPVDYAKVAKEATAFAAQNGITRSSADKTRVCLLLIDAQLTFCNKDFELPVSGADADNKRICEFIYEHVGRLTNICFTMDTHESVQIFHPFFFVDKNGEHPTPGTQVTNADIKSGRWHVNPSVAWLLANGNLGHVHQHVLHYTEQLESTGRYVLTIWPYHAMLGSIGHAIVPAVHEAAWFHAVARQTKFDVEIKGGNPWTENYSVFRPEVLKTVGDQVIAHRNTKLIDRLLSNDVIIVGGQAKSHCVAWSMHDLLSEIASHDPTLAKKLYFVEDFSSPVIIPGVIDFTQQANEAFDEFKARGVNVVRSTTPFKDWPGISNII